VWREFQKSLPTSNTCLRAVVPQGQSHEAELEFGSPGVGSFGEQREDESLDDESWNVQRGQGCPLGGQRLPEWGQLGGLQKALGFRRGLLTRGLYTGGRPGLVGEGPLGNLPLAETKACPAVRLVVELVGGTYAAKQRPQLCASKL
jgi:hypothetical protein